MSSALITENPCNNTPLSIFEKLQQQKDDISFFKTCISFALAKNRHIDEEDAAEWNTILMRLMKVLAANERIGSEQILTASHAFFALHSKLYAFSERSRLLTEIFKTEYATIPFSSTVYHPVDTELFRLNIIYGYLLISQLDPFVTDVYKSMFGVIYEHCIRYTKCSYFAHKLLYKWLLRTVNSEFWNESDETLENQLEAVIASNWNNSISHISKQNSSVFNVYLKIMKEKYDGFLEFVFKHCVDNISWKNETKYAILSEICDLLGDIKHIMSKDFILSLFTSLTRHNLRSAGTELYLVISANLNEQEWKIVFGDAIKFVISHWESGPNQNHDALESLCKYWLEPVIITHKNILTFLWSFSQDSHSCIYRSHLLRIASELHVDLKETTPPYYGNHEHEMVRLNAFAADCCIEKLIDAVEDDPFTRIKEFLWYNANANTVIMRIGIIKYFKVLYANLLRASEISSHNSNHLRNFSTWIYEYFLDCFEIGSCYQRKVLALKLYNTVLSFADGGEDTVKRFNSKEQARYKAIIEKHLKCTGNWNFTDKKILFALLKLVLDTEADSRNLAGNAIIRYFHKNTLTDSEKQAIMVVGLKNCNSSKFYEIESGAVLIKILSHWRFFHDKNIVENNFATYSEILLHSAQQQFVLIKQDILKAVVRDKPFYGVLTALLNIAFQGGPESNYLTINLAKNILSLLEDAVNFLLSILSSKSANTEYSSSFEEMDLAINETIRTSQMNECTDIDELELSSAHEVVLSCIWMSLKICCEIACEIGMLKYNEEMVTSCLNLIVTVLTRCRHKGAIEFAGAAIGNLTRCLCNTNEYCDLPKTYVVDLLNSGEINAGKYITRRGAGLTIMFHKIVASDNRNGRPLLHFTVNELLDSLEDHTQLVENKSIFARRLHFLRALVADKELNTQIIPYMERISQMCFSFLGVQLWTVRNASLQLFGAVVPRLVGQTLGGKALDFGNGYSVDHFITHYPALANYITKELEDFCGNMYPHTLKRDARVSSNILPVLTLLSKLSTGGCDLIDYSSGNFLRLAKSNLRGILCNDVGHVRYLAAKAYAALTPFSQIAAELERLMSDILTLKNNNSVHGHLLAVYYLRKKLSVEGMNLSPNCTTESVARHSRWDQFVGLPRLQYLSECWSKTVDEKVVRRPDYILETLFLEVSDFSTFLVDHFLIEKIISQCNIVMPMERIKPGFFEFLDTLIKLYAEYVKCTGTVRIGVIEELSKCECMIVSFLKHLSVFEPLLEVICTQLVFMLDRSNETLLNVMISFVIDTLKESTMKCSTNLNFKKTAMTLVKKIPGNETCTRFFRLKCILILVFSDSNDTINDVLQSIFDMCFNEDESFRYMAVECLHVSLRRFNELNTDNKLLVVHCCLGLLKDEVSEIRDLTAKYLQENRVLVFDTENMIVHNEIIYEKMLWEVAFGHSLFRHIHARTNIKFIRKLVQIRTNSKSGKIIENPFEHESNVLYREESKFLNIIFLGGELRKKRDDSLRECVDAFTIFNARYQLQKKMNLDLCCLNTALSLKYAEYLSRKQGVVLQECYLNS